MIVPLAEPSLMPPAIMSVAKSRTCSATQSLTTHTPHLRVDATVRGDSLTLNVALLSIVGTSTSPKAFHAFISVDGKPVVLNLAPQAFISLTYPGLAAGTHYVRYGVYREHRLLQDNSFCSTIAFPERRGKYRLSPGS